MMMAEILYNLKWLLSIALVLNRTITKHILLYASNLGQSPNYSFTLSDGRVKQAKLLGVVYESLSNLVCGDRSLVVTMLFP